MNKIFKRKYSLQAKTKCICFCCLKTLSLFGINPTKQSYERGWCFWYNRPHIAIIEPYATQEDKEIFLKLPVFFGPQELSQILREQQQKEILFLEEIGILSPRLEELLKAIEAYVWEPIFALKQKWDRARPIAFMPLHHVGEKPHYGSYPSGTAVEAYILGNVLSRYFPKKKEALLALAERISQHRVDCGFNFPSDVVYAKQLADNLTEEIIRIFGEEIKNVVPDISGNLCPSETSSLRAEKLIYQDVDLAKVIEDLGPLSGKKFQIKTTKPLKVSDVFYVKDWRLFIDLFCMEHQLLQIETGNEISIEEIK